MATAVISIHPLAVGHDSTLQSPVSPVSGGPDTIAVIRSDTSPVEAVVRPVDVRHIDRTGGGPSGLHGHTAGGGARAKEEPENDDDGGTTSSIEDGEMDPLQHSQASRDADTASDNLCLDPNTTDAENDDCWSKDFDRDSQKGGAGSGSCDPRHVMIAVFVVVLIAGAIGLAFMAHKFKG